MNTLVRWLTRSTADHSSAAQPGNRFRPAVERLDHRVVPSRSVSGFVYVDADDDGVFESGESPIPGVTVTLTGTDIYNSPVGRTTTTNAAGRYLFDHLEPGVYTVAQTQPVGFDDGQETQGTPPSGGVGPDRFTDLYFDAEGEVQYEHYNFGEKLRATPSGVIGDRIWNDANGNGVQDGGEAGVAGVTVTLSGPGGPRTAVTDASGRYQFTGLAAGTYTVSFTTPAGYTLTAATVGTDRTIDSNFTAVTPTVPGTTTIGTTNLITNGGFETAPTGTTGATQVVAADGSIYATLGSNKDVWRYTPATGWKQTGGWNVTDLVAADGGVYARTSDTNTWRYTPAGGWQFLGGSSANPLVVAADGGVYAVRADLKAWRYTPATGWVIFNGNRVSSVAAGDDGAVYVIKDGNAVWRWTPAGGWVDTGGRNVTHLVGKDGGIYARTADTNIWRYTQQSGWQFLGQSSLLTPGGWGMFTGVQGWNAVNTATAPRNLLELGQAWAYGVGGPGNNVIAELDANGGDAGGGLFQVVNTTAGQQYQLTFDLAARGGTNLNTNTVEVFWNGTKVGTFSPVSNTLNTYTLTVTGAGGPTLLEFREAAGQDDWVGGILDNVRLVTRTTTAGVQGVNTATVTIAAGETNQTIDGGLQLRTTVSGVEDTGLTLSVRDFALAAISGATGVTITALPATGQLQYLSGATWVSVTVGQTISKADLAAGRVRFLPASNESGEGRYNAPGVGNMKNDYTTVGYSVLTGAAAQPGRLTIDITPVVDLGTLDLAIVAYGHAYSTNGLYGYAVWPPNFPAPLPGEVFLDKFQFTLTGSSPDQDGSERTLIGLTNLTVGGVKERVFKADGREVKPDANGVVWISPNAQYYISIPLCHTEFDYLVVRQEVNAAGQVLDQASRVGHFGYVSPLVLDLDGNGVETISQDAGVQFDLDGDGVKESVGWVAPTDGLLAQDLNGNGAIDDGTELFGNATRLAGGMTAGDGYEALAALDSNGDGAVSAADETFGRLRVWVDANSDGVSQAHELKTLDSLGIASLNYTATGGVERQNGNLLDRKASYTTADGRTRDLVDVWFRSDVISTTPIGSTVDRPVAPAAETNLPATPAQRTHEQKSLGSLGVESLSATPSGGVQQQNRKASDTTAEGHTNSTGMISTTPPGSSVDRPVAPAAESNRPSTPAERPRATALAVRQVTSSLPVTESGSASGTPLAKVGGLGTPVGTEPAADALFEALKRARSVFVD